MRKAVKQQLPLMSTRIVHEHTVELQEMDRILDSIPGIVQHVHRDLTGHASPVLGREGMSGEQILRALIIKQMNQYSYDELAFHLMDSRSYRQFCRIGDFERVSRATLQRNIKSIRTETLEKVHKQIIKVAIDEKVETAKAVRADSTVIESNIHPPTDSTLLMDSVRILSRWIKRGIVYVTTKFPSRVRLAKKRTVAIQYAKYREERNILYRDLVRVTEETVHNAEILLKALKFKRRHTAKKLANVVSNLELYLPRARQVIEQTRRRVFDGEKVPCGEKIVSIFEEHTDIIVKSRRKTEYGHKLFLSAGKSGLIIDCFVERGNPADSQLATKIVQRQINTYGVTPQQVAFDGGFASQENLSAIKELGVQDVSFSKRCGLAITDMVKSAWVYKKLRRFRAGIESVISFMKRSGGLSRCTWRSYSSTKSYVVSAVLSANLLILAKNLTAKTAR